MTTLDKHLPRGISTIIDQYVDTPVPFHQEFINNTRQLYETLDRFHRFHYDLSKFEFYKMNEIQWDIMPKLEAI